MTRKCWQPHLGHTSPTLSPLVLESARLSRGTYRLLPCSCDSLIRLCGGAGFTSVPNSTAP